MKHLDLFSGIGGFALAAQWAGIETVAFCEINEECIKVLNKHWPDVKKHNDIKELNGKEYEGIDIITGGYPCQPFSVAGSQKAHKDNRHLWPEMCRIITQAKPTWAICENVYGHIKLGLDSVQHDLEAIGYTSQPFIIPALSTGANHNRDRVFTVAYTASNGFDESETGTSNGKANEHNKKRKDKNSNNERCSGLRFGMDWQGNPIGRRGTKPPPLRVDDELPRRMDRNKMIGNAIDPMIAYELLRTIKVI
jgi:DNA (cytosine-5)-methyltransferase 1